MAIFLSWTLPMPIVATPGTTVAYSDIIAADFGASTTNWTGTWVTYYPASQLAAWDLNYWNPNSPSVAQWFVNGADIGGGFDHQTFVPATNFSTVALKAGNDIGPLAYTTIAVSGASGNYAEYIQYSAITIDPQLMRQGAGTGEPTAADIVATAYRFDSFYGDKTILNDNDCHYIASAVAAASGATFTDNTQHIDNPALNEEGGFWRVVYRGSDPNPVSNWQTLVQPGDIIRMGWTGGGQHTTTVLAVNADGSMVVYDNADRDGQNREVIGIHTVHYDQQTIAADTTIYRLTTDGLYLETGTANDETLPGTRFNDHMIGGGGNDLLAGAAGNDLVEGGTGNDVLNGGAGADSVYGNSGDDTFKVDNAADKTFELAGEGADSVFAYVSYALQTGQSIELLATGSRPGTAAINLTGNGLAQRIDGNYGANVLTSGGGGDTLNGFLGNDTFIVSSAADRVYETAGQGSDTVFSSVTYALAHGQSVELLSTTARAGTTAITLTGNEQAQRIDGNYGVNGLYGGDGNDTLYGFNGNDKLGGGNGRDVMDGGNGADTFAYSAVGQSTGAGRDLISNINFAQDRIDLQVAVTGIDAKVTGGTLNESGFDAALAAKVGSGQLAAHHAVLFDPGAGTADHGADLYLVIDVNGTAGYQANADYVIELANATGTLTLGDFT